MNDNSNRPRIGAHIRIDKAPPPPYEEPPRSDAGVGLILWIMTAFLIVIAGGFIYLFVWPSAAKADERDKRVSEIVERVVPPWYVLYGAGAGERIQYRDEPAGPNPCGPRKFRVEAGRTAGEAECIGR